MKSLSLLCVLLLSMFRTGQNPNTGGHKASGELETVLSEMDKSAATFKAAQADFEWDNYQKVVDETDKQTGNVVFRRSNGNVEAMFKITAPAPKEILYNNGVLYLYEQKIDQVTEHKAENKADVEAYLSLGFGARGHDLLKNYDVKMAGWETIDGVKTAKLELVAKAVNVRNMFSQFVLWIDPQRDFPIKQQVFSPSGDYWLSHYTNIKLVSKVPDSAFHLDTTPRTRKVVPR
jgi:outer membrane lipoprotein-sorting protein